MIPEFRELVARVTELEQRLAHVIVYGQVTDVDYDKGLYRVEVGEDENGEPVKSAWLRSSESAGWESDANQAGVSTWTPYVKGQQVRVLSPGGQIGEQSWIEPGGYRDKYPQISQDGNAMQVKVGAASMIIRSDRIELSVGGKRIIITENQILTDGKTVLNNGTRKVHYVGALDSDGDAAVGGADEVLV